MAIRFPMGGARLMGALKDILPKTGAEWARRLGPEAGFALMGAAMAPEGVTGAERAGLAAEDALLGLGTSLLGAGLGRAAFGLKYPSSMSRAAYDAAREKHLSNFISAGDIVGAPLIMMAPRPYANSVYARLFDEQTRREEEQTRQQVEQQQMMAAALTPALAGSASLLGGGLMGMAPISAVL